MEDKNKNQRLNTSQGEIIEQPDKSQNIEYKESPERWYNLVSFCFCILADGFQWLIFSQISREFSYYYEKSLWKVNIIPVIYFIIYPLVCIPEGWLIEQYNIKLCLKIASGTILIGSLLKIFTNLDKSLSVCYIGHIFAGLFRPLLLNSPGKIATNWFNEDKRVIICSIGYLCDVVGILAGYVFNLVYFKENQNKDVFRDKMYQYTLSEFLICFLLCIPGFFIEKDLPDKPCSPSQYKYNLKKLTLVENLKLLFTNCQFIILLIPIFFIVGYFYIMGTEFNELMYIYGITKNKCSIIYSVSIIVGVISSLIFACFLNKYWKYKLFMIILCILAIVFQVFLTFMLEVAKSKDYNAFVISLIFNILINAAVTPLYVILMNYAFEITYTIPESITGGITMSMAHLCGIFGTYLFDYFINHHNNKPWISNVVILIFFAVSFVFILFLKEQLFRYQTDKEGRINEKEDEKEEQKEENNTNEAMQVNVEIKQ